jgi:prophage tail gpP-like protein
MRMPEHKVSVVVGKYEVRGWSEYSITTSIVEPADTFEMRLPFDRQAWDLLTPDQPIKVLVDGVCVLSGFLDESPLGEGEEELQIRGRCRIGRLVDESAPAFRYQGLALDRLIAQLAAPWFTKVTISNARNRRVLRGKGRKAIAGGEPLRLAPRKDGLLVEPGQMRWSVIEELLGQAGLLCTAAGDGTELVIFRPNYDQEVQFRFFHPAASSRRSREGNVLALSIERSTAQRYSRILVVGAGRGTDSNYGAAVSSRYGEAKDNPSDADGVGRDFTAPKRLIIQEPVQSADEARELAAREMSRRDGQGAGIRVTVPMHGQVVAGQFPTLFACDTLAHVEDERTGTKGVYLITACTFKSTRQGGEQTQLELVPKGTELAA